MGPKVDVASALLLHQESADAHFIIQTLKRCVSVPPPVMKGLGVVGNQEMGQKEALAPAVPDGSRHQGSHADCGSTYTGFGH